MRLPAALIGDGDMRANRGYIFGREILMTQPTIVKDFDTANSSDIFGYFFQPFNYCINFNYGFTVDRYYNYEKRKWITVATMVFDGKPYQQQGLYEVCQGLRRYINHDYTRSSARFIHRARRFVG